MIFNPYSSQLLIHFSQIRRNSRYIRNHNFSCRIWRKLEGGPHDQAYLEVEKKIEEALKTGVTELDLRKMKLTELPESIGQLKQ